MASDHWMINKGEWNSAALQYRSLDLGMVSMQDGTVFRSTALSGRGSLSSGMEMVSCRRWDENLRPTGHDLQIKWSWSEHTCSSICRLWLGKFPGCPLTQQCHVSSAEIWAYCLVFWPRFRRSGIPSPKQGGREGWREGSMEMGEWEKQNKEMERERGERWGERGGIDKEERRKRE